MFLALLSFSAVVTDFDTIMMQPLDPIIEVFLADDTVDAAADVCPPAITLPTRNSPTSAPTFLTTSSTSAPVSQAPASKPTPNQPQNQL